MDMTVSLSTRIYGFQETRVCMNSSGSRSHWYMFCTSTGYLFLYNFYEANNTIYINLISTDHDAYLTSELMSLLNCSLLGLRSYFKLLTMYMVVEYCYFFRKAFTHSISLEIVSRQRWVTVCACTSDRERSTRVGETCTSRKSKLSLMSMWT